MGGTTAQTGRGQRQGHAPSLISWVVIGLRSRQGRGRGFRTGWTDRVEWAWPGARPRPALKRAGVVGLRSRRGRGLPVGLQAEGRGSGEGAWPGGRGARARPGRRGRRRASRCVLARPRPQSAPATARAPWFPARRAHSCGPWCWGSDWPCWASRPGSGRQVRSDGGADRPGTRWTGCNGVEERRGRGAGSPMLSGHVCWGQRGSIPFFHPQPVPQFPLLPLGVGSRDSRPSVRESRTRKWRAKVWGRDVWFQGGHASSSSPAGLPRSVRSGDLGTGSELPADWGVPVPPIPGGVPIPSGDFSAQLCWGRAPRVGPRARE